MPGPSAAITSCGLRPKFHLHAPESFFRDALKRAAPAGMNGGDRAPFLESASRIGTQSAVCTTSRRPGSFVIRASPLRASSTVQGSRNLQRARCPNEFGEARSRAFCSLQARVKKSCRFSRTRSRVSQSVKPRFKMFLVASPPSQIGLQFACATRTRAESVQRANRTAARPGASKICNPRAWRIPNRKILAVCCERFARLKRFFFSIVASHSRDRSSRIEVRGHLSDYRILIARSRF